MIYLLGPAETIQEISSTPWVRPRLDGEQAITKRGTAPSPLPTGVAIKTHAEALEITRTAEWNPPVE